jgi:serine/threonine protein kinase
MNPHGLSPGNTLAPGTRLGAFEVISPLGHGGMGAVYRVKNRITGDERALKLILPELAARPEFVERFVREIRLAMAVDHPNLVRVFEPGMDGDNIFLPMELLEGESLATYVKREGYLQVDSAIGLLQAIGSALSALHARGILHRDVKPSNVFLALEGAGYTPKLLDLGAGKEVGGSDEATATGAAIGSPHYMAPEQASGRKDLDARVDQYAFAVLAYQLLTGARPYENDDTGHVLAKVLCGAAYRLPRELRPEIPVEVEAAVLRAMSREREQRFASVDDFLRALVVRSSAGELAPPPSLEGTRVAPLAARGASTGAGDVAAPNERSGTMGASAFSPPPGRAPGGKLWVIAAAISLTLVGALVLAASSRSSATRAPPPSESFGRPAAQPPPPTPPQPEPPLPSAAPLPPATAAATPANVPLSAPSATPSPATAPAIVPVVRAASPTPVASEAPTPRSSHPAHPKAAAPAPAVGEPCHATPGAPCL